MDTVGYQELLPRRKGCVECFVVVVVIVDVHDVVGVVVIRISQISISSPSGLALIANWDLNTLIGQCFC
jgi:hypothetical protein